MNPDQTNPTASQTNPIAIVSHNPAERRFETVVDGHLAIAAYDQRGQTIIFTHTRVSPELRGRGVAGKLVRTALEHARQEKLHVVPGCSYVAAFINRNPEFQPLLAG